MNLPNRLTIARVICIPFIVLFLSLSAPWCRWAALILFMLASFTDYLDGYLARKNNLITDFGKFLDPIADKLLVLSTLIMLIQMGLIPAWLVILILARELSVDGLRLIAVTKGKVIAAGTLGKLKTVSQMLLIILLLAYPFQVFSRWYGTVLAIWVAFITLYSGVDYFRRNGSLLKN